MAVVPDVTDFKCDESVQPVVRPGASLPGEGGRGHLRHWHELHL